MPALTRVQKAEAKKTQRAVARRCGEVTQGKPGVASTACVARHYSRETQRNLHMQHTDVVTLTFDPKINRFAGLTVEHVCVRFGDTSCIGFWDTYPTWGWGTPFPPLLLPCPFPSSSFALCYFSSFPFLTHFTYFLLLSIRSLSTRIVPLRFQACDRSRRLNLGLVCFLFMIVLSVLLS